MNCKLAFTMLLCCGSLVFAQEGGIPDGTVNTVVTKYLEGIFNRHLVTTGLRVTELSFTTNMSAQSAEKDKHLYHYNVQGRFKNFPIDNRRLSGRLETTIIARNNAGNIGGLGGKPDVLEKDNSKLNISLLVDDLLSDELRDATVRNYITTHYEHPLDININKERVEIYPDKIFSYVTAVVNSNSIVYLRAIFEKQPSATKKVNVFTIIETPWQLNRAETIFNEAFPNHNSFKSDIKKDMFETMRGYFLKTNKSRTINEGGSKVESITKTELKEANNGLIKIELHLIYLVDWWGLPNSYQRYNVIVNAYYQFNFEKRKWEYQRIENINPDNITIR